MHWDPNGEGHEIRRGVISIGVLNSSHMSIGVTRLEPGHEEKPHAHESEQIACILQGEVQFDVGDELVVLRTGDVLAIPSNVTHKGRVLGEEAVIILDAWYPRRTVGS